MKYQINYSYTTAEDQIEVGEFKVDAESSADIWPKIVSLVDSDTL